VEVRVASASPSEAVRGRLAYLVRERQALRDEKAASFVLEENRRGIVEAQHELAQALLPEHAEAVPA
jgi:hypothetical protein